jgi:hypothetical protein
MTVAGFRTCIEGTMGIFKKETSVFGSNAQKYGDLGRPGNHLSIS